MDIFISELNGVFIAFTDTIFIYCNWSHCSDQFFLSQRKGIFGELEESIFPKSNLNSTEEREEESSIYDHNEREQSALNSLLYQYT